MASTVTTLRRRSRWWAGTSITRTSPRYRWDGSRAAAAASTRSSAPPSETRSGQRSDVVAVTKTRAAAVIMGGLARLAGVRRASARWRYRAGPTFDNSIGVLELDGRWAGVTIFRAEPGRDGRLRPLHTRVLGEGPRAAAQERAEPASR